MLNVCLFFLKSQPQYAYIKTCIPLAIIWQLLAIIWQLLAIAVGQGNTQTKARHYKELQPRNIEKNQNSHSLVKITGSHKKVYI